MLAAGNRARDQQDWPRAAAYYRAYLDHRPRRFAIWVQYGHALKESGQRAAALAAYSEALRLDPDDADLLLNLGHLHKVMGHADLAVGFYQRSAAIAATPDVQRELLALGHEPSGGQRSDSGPSGRRTPSGPGAPSASRRAMIEGNAARDRRDWPTAAQAYRAHLRIRPDNFPIWVQLGHALKESGQREAALEAYHAALRLRPDDADLLLNLGHLHKVMGRRDQAIDFYRRSARLNPIHGVLQELRALGADPGDIPEVQPILRPSAARVRAVRPPGLRALVGGARRWLIEGNQARDRRDWPAAAEAYRAHLKSRPDNFPIWVQLGHALKESGRMQEAEQAYGRAMGLNPADADLLMNLGHLYKITGDHGAAADHYRRSADIDGNSAAIAELLAIDTGRLPAALVRLASTPEVQSDLDLVRQSELFDPKFYLEHNPDVVEWGGDPLEHFIRWGGVEGRAASPLFDSGYYLRTNADVATIGLNPLVHYIRFGDVEGRNPATLFDIAWYRARYGEGAKHAGTFLAHFLKFGGLISPSTEFDTESYLARYPDVFQSGMNPLVHYLVYGHAEGRRATVIMGDEPPWPHCTQARLLEVKPLAARPKRVALFITHSRNGRVRPSVDHYISALAECDVEVVLIVATDQSRTTISQHLADQCAAVFIRENVGFDFAAWAHVMAHTREVLAADILYLINDSMIGPTDLAQFHALMERIDQSSSDLVGLTENHHGAWHLQSFFLAIKKTALSSYPFQQFFGEIVSFPDKDRVINHYEVTLTAHMRRNGFACDTLFGRPRQPPIMNDTIYFWRELLDDGMPFVKRSLIAGEHADRGGEPVTIELAARGYPVVLLDEGAGQHNKPQAHLIGHMRKAGQAFVERFDENGRRIEEPATAPAPTGAAGAAVDHRLRVALITPSSYANGLGMAGRGYASAVFHTDFSWDLRPNKRPFHIHGRVAPAWRALSNGGAPDVAIIHCNPGSWSALLDAGDRWTIGEAKRRVGLFVWELSRLPDEWIPTLNLLDAVIVPSQYCAEIFRRATDLPIHVVPHVVPGPPPLTPAEQAQGRAKLERQFGVPAARRLILYAFDGSSYLPRKNPYALVRAFKASGLSARGWTLILKTKHLSESSQDAVRLMADIGGDPAITLIDRAMAPRDQDALFAAADIYASPHASEGFGLTIAEAMAAGKIVVATDYSGSTDFLDPSTGFPVRWTEHVLDQQHGPYEKGGVWAEVDERHLAEALQGAADVVNGVSLDHAGMGERARQRTETLLSARAVGARLQEVLTTVAEAPQYADRTINL